MPDKPQYSEYNHPWSEAPKTRQCSECGKLGTIALPQTEEELDSLVAAWNLGMFHEPQYFAPEPDWKDNQLMAFTGDLCFFCWHHRSAKAGWDYNDRKEGKESEATNAMEASMDARYAKASLDQFPGQVSTSCRQWLRHSPHEWCLLISGPSDSGKTHLLWGMYREAHTQGMAKWRVHIPVIADDLRGKDTGRLVRTQSEYEGLMLYDDLGRENDDWLAGVLFKIFDARYASNRKTLICTELDPDGIRRKYGNHMERRAIQEARIIRLAGRE